MAISFDAFFRGLSTGSQLRRAKDQREHEQWSRKQQEERLGFEKSKFLAEQAAARDKAETEAQAGELRAARVPFPGVYEPPTPKPGSMPMVFMANQPRPLNLMEGLSQKEKDEIRAEVRGTPSSGPPDLEEARRLFRERQRKLAAARGPRPPQVPFAPEAVVTDVSDEAEVNDKNIPRAAPAPLPQVERATFADPESARSRRIFDPFFTAAGLRKKVEQASPADEGSPLFEPGKEPELTFERPAEGEGEIDPLLMRIAALTPEDQQILGESVWGQLSETQKTQLMLELGGTRSQPEAIYKAVQFLVGAQAADEGRYGRTGLTSESKGAVDRAHAMPDRSGRTKDQKANRDRITAETLRAIILAEVRNEPGMRRIIESAPQDADWNDISLTLHRLRGDPQGDPTVRYKANLALRALDEQLSSIKDQPGAKYMDTTQTKVKEAIGETRETILRDLTSADLNPPRNRTDAISIARDLGVDPQEAARLYDFMSGSREQPDRILQAIIGLSKPAGGE